MLYVIIISFISIFPLKPTWNYYNRLEHSGGCGIWSDAIFDIAAEVDQHLDQTVVVWIGDSIQSFCH